MEENEKQLDIKKEKTEKKSFLGGFFGGVLLVALVVGALFQSYNYGLLEAFGYSKEEPVFVPSQVLLKGNYFVPMCDKPSVVHSECENTFIEIVEDNFMRHRDRVPGERNIDVNFIPTGNVLVDEKVVEFFESHADVLHARVLEGQKADRVNIASIDYELVMLAKPVFSENGSGVLVFSGYQNYETGAFNIIDYKINFNKNGIVGGLPTVPK